MRRVFSGSRADPQGQARRIFAALVAALVAAAMLATPAIAQTLPADEEYHRDYIYGVPEAPADGWVLSSGGRLYDNWANALGVKAPESTHPAYPAAGSQSGSGTWRCKECHGWDYRGVEGKYGGGSHFSGIVGVRDWVAAEPGAIVAILRDATHRYSEEMIPPDAANRLASFVSMGQHDTDAYIESETGEVRGDVGRGAEVFQTVCAACHGFQGTALDWGEPGDPSYIGTEAQSNPWEILHKIRNGHPGTEMVSLRAFDLQTAVDLLAHARTLPAE